MDERSIISVTIFLVLNLFSTTADQRDWGKMPVLTKYTFDANCGNQPVCNQIWKDFKGIYKCVGEDCRRNESSTVDPLFTKYPVGVDKPAFWSKVGKEAPGIAHQYKEDGYKVLGDTQLRKTFNSVKWCCYWNNCTYENNKTCFADSPDFFWRKASKEFAEKASGKVILILDAHLEKPYAENSYFRNVEMPNLSQRVTAMDVLLLVNPSEEGHTYNCSSSNIKELEKHFKSRNENGIFTCTNNISIFAPNYTPSCEIGKRATDEGCLTPSRELLEDIVTFSGVVVNTPQLYSFVMLMLWHYLI